MRGRDLSLGTIEATLRSIRGVQSLSALRRFTKDARKTVVRACEARRVLLQEENQRLRTLMREERKLYRQGFTLIAGVDEVGVGPLAGPVMAAAVILHKSQCFFGMNDSKKLSRKKREHLAAVILQKAVAVSVGSCTPEEIDRLNILQASKEAMRRAVQGLCVAPEALLVDARHIPGVELPQRALIHGDAISHSIAAASIVAKVHRDRLMSDYDTRFPEYGFAKHSGYGTAFHMRALKEYGPCAIHRHSFAPVRALVRCRALSSGLSGFNLY